MPQDRTDGWAEWATLKGPERWRAGLPSRRALEAQQAFRGDHKCCAGGAPRHAGARVWGDVTRKRADEVWVRS